VIMVTRPWTG